MKYYGEARLTKALRKVEKQGIKTGVPGLYTGEPEFIKEMARLAPDGPGVEIGPRYGNTIIMWGKERRGRIIGIDLIDRPLLRENIAKSGLPIEIIIGDSATVDIPIEEIASLFIDGDHRAPAIWNDTVRYTPLVMKGGIVVFHDYGHSPKRYPEFAVKRYVKAWHDATGWERIGRVRYAIAFRR